MPIYEYECGKCGKRFEYSQKMAEPPKKKCEKCGGKLDKLISASSFSLKGGGWYKDLYASPKPGASASGGSDGDSSGSASSASGSEKGDKGAKSNKPEAKADKAEAKAPKAESKPEKASSSSRKAKRK